MDNAAAAPSPDDSPVRNPTSEPSAQPPSPEVDEDAVDEASDAGNRSASVGDAASDTGSPRATSAAGAAGSAPVPATPRRRRIGVLIAVAAAAYVLDLVSKLLVVAKLADHDPIHLIGTVVQLTYIRNSGAAFSLGVGYTAAFSLIAVVVVVAIIRVSRRLYSAAWAVALGLLLGGALGNLTDRIARSPGFFRGWVVDFIDVPHFAVFNLADSAISVGGVLMVLLAFRGLHPDGTDERSARVAPAAADEPEQAPADAGEGSPAAADRPDAAEPEPAPDKVEQ